MPARFRRELTGRIVSHKLDGNSGGGGGTSSIASKRAMAETARDGDLSRRGFLVGAGVAALGLAGLRVLIERRDAPTPTPSPLPAAPEPAASETEAPATAPEAPPARPRLRAQVTEMCFACGLCIQTCPEVFRLGDAAAEVIVAEVPAEVEERCRQAVRDCPAEAIVLVEG